jgi:hypothetical protein
LEVGCHPNLDIRNIVRVICSTNRFSSAYNYWSQGGLGLASPVGNDDYEAHVHELVSEWNYTERQARLLNPGAMEWMAVPLKESGRVEAVVLDVNQRDFFTAERQELVLAATRGIAVFIGRRSD